MTKSSEAFAKLAVILQKRKPAPRLSDGSLQMRLDVFLLHPAEFFVGDVTLVTAEDTYFGILHSFAFLLKTGKLLGKIVGSRHVPLFQNLAA